MPAHGAGVVSRTAFFPGGYPLGDALGAEDMLAGQSDGAFDDAVWGS